MHVTAAGFLAEMRKVEQFFTADPAAVSVVHAEFGELARADVARLIRLAERAAR